MRAPPVAVKQTNGSFCSMADAHAAHEALADDRAHRAAHEVELERGARPRGSVLIAPPHHDQRVGLAGLLAAPPSAARGTCVLSLNFSASTGSTSGPIS